MSASLSTCLLSPFGLEILRSTVVNDVESLRRHLMLLSESVGGLLESVVSELERITLHEFFGPLHIAYHCRSLESFAVFADLYKRRFVNDLAGLLAILNKSSSTGFKTSLVFMIVGSYDHVIDLDSIGFSDKSSTPRVSSAQQDILAVQYLSELLPLDSIGTLQNLVAIQSFVRVGQRLRICDLFRSVCSISLVAWLSNKNMVRSIQFVLDVVIRLCPFLNMFQCRDYYVRESIRRHFYYLVLSNCDDFGKTPVEFCLTYRQGNAIKSTPSPLRIDALLHLGTSAILAEKLLLTNFSRHDLGAPVRQNAIHFLSRGGVSFDDGLSMSFVVNALEKCRSLLGFQWIEPTGSAVTTCGSSAGQRFDVLGSLVDFCRRRISQPSSIREDDFLSLCRLITISRSFSRLLSIPDLDRMCEIFSVLEYRGLMNSRWTDYHRQWQLLVNNACKGILLTSAAESSGIASAASGLLRSVVDLYTEQLRSSRSTDIVSVFVQGFAHRPLTVPLKLPEPSLVEHLSRSYFAERSTTLLSDSTKHSLCQSLVFLAFNKAARPRTLSHMERMLEFCSAGTTDGFSYRIDPSVFFGRMRAVRLLATISMNGYALYGILTDLDDRNLHVVVKAPRNMLMLAQQPSVPSGTSASSSLETSQREYRERPEFRQLLGSVAVPNLCTSFAVDKLVGDQLNMLSDYTSVFVRTEGLMSAPSVPLNLVKSCDNSTSNDGKGSSTNNLRDIYAMDFQGPTTDYLLYEAVEASSRPSYLSTDGSTHCNILRDFLDAIGRHCELHPESASQPEFISAVVLDLVLILLQIVNGLSLAQQWCSFTHYDLKDDNILLTNTRTSNVVVPLSGLESMTSNQQTLLPTLLPKRDVRSIRLRSFAVKIIDFGLSYCRIGCPSLGAFSELGCDRLSPSDNVAKSYNPGQDLFFLLCCIFHRPRRALPVAAVRQLEWLLVPFQEMLTKYRWRIPLATELQHECKPYLQLTAKWYLTYLCTAMPRDIALHVFASTGGASVYAEPAKPLTNTLEMED